ncbi:hypothetical protein SAMN04487949_2469 [Halogranum gelatinilyticum]|uniref:DUF8108 domain-containing protein n=1 Tax=Halogranum gelatinilyticum TaxID=660521 RepID=A0A1G9VQU4_9EURY|nr:hypothetical protein [Halogranum gelatinilyticum]SDM74477.1 hypothetical protein SAMN04487949_2469 [Halogranum gelatinilyticum]
MSDEPSSVVALADSVSDLLNGIAGWLLVGFGVAGLLSAGGSVVQLVGGASPAPNPAVIPFLTLFSLLFVTFGMFVNPRFRRRLDRRHAPSRFGWVRSVDDRVVHADEDCRERCVVCEDRVDRGLDRRYRSEFVVAGVPVYTASEDHNYYCLACATADRSGVAAESVTRPAADANDLDTETDESDTDTDDHDTRSVATVDER